MKKKTDWKTKAEVAKQISDLLVQNQMSILPKGLDDLWTALKARLKETNKAVLRPFIKLSG